MIFQRDESAALLDGDGGGLGIDGVQAEVGVVGAVVEKAGVENVPRREIVLHAEKIVACPLFGSVGVRGQLIDDVEGVLDADGIRKPKAAALDGSGKSDARIPISEMSAFLDVDSGSGVGRAEAPAIFAVGSFKTENARARVSIACAEAAGLDCGGARGVNVEACRQCAVDRIADFKAIEEILRLTGTCTRNVQIIATVAHDIGQGHETLGENVRVGHRDIANVLRGETGTPRSVLSINLMRRRGDLYLLVKLLNVIQGQCEFIAAGLERERLARKQEKTFLANFYFVVTHGKILEDESPCAIGLCAIHPAGAVFELYFRSPNRYAVFVHHGTRTIGGISSLHFDGSKKANRNPYNSK